VFVDGMFQYISSFNSNKNITGPKQAGGGSGSDVGWDNDGSGGVRS
jgi:hypothetical protein